VKLKLSELRKIIRQVVLESYGGALGIDPTNLDSTSDGFYPFELERGVDIYSKWYRSPGEKTGDPGRPEDAAEYIGIKPKEPVEPEQPAEEE
jgi:hypothetical protein